MALSHTPIAMTSTEHTLWVSAHHRRPRRRAGRGGAAQPADLPGEDHRPPGGGIGDTLQAAAENTADAALIPQVAGGVEAVLAEGLQHHLFLGRVLGKVKS